MKSDDFLIQDGYNLSNLEAQFREYLAAVINLRAVSIKNYVSDLRYFFGWYIKAEKLPQAIFYPDRLTQSDILSYRKYLVSGDLPARTVNRRLSSIRAFCGFLVSQNIIDINPAKGIGNLGSKKPRGQHSPALSLSGEDAADFEAYLKESLPLDHSTSKTILAHVSEFLSVASDNNA